MQAGNITYSDAQDFPETVPLFPLSGALLLPGGQMPLNIFEPRYLALFDTAIAGERLVGIVQPLAETLVSPSRRAALAPGFDGEPVLAQIGGIGRIVSFNETGDGRYVITLSGICRFRLLDEIRPALWSVFQLVPTGRGKVDDLFAGRNIASVHAATNAEGYHLVGSALETMARKQ